MGDPYGESGVLGGGGGGGWKEVPREKIVKKILPKISKIGKILTFPPIFFFHLQWPIQHWKPNIT